MPELKSLSYKPTGTFFGDSTGEPLGDSPGTTNTGYSISHSLSGGELPKSVSYGDLNRETLYTIMNDQTNKYIGAKPTAAKLQDSASEMYQNGQIPSSGQLAPDTKKSTGSSVAGTIAGEVGKAVLDTASAKANIAQDTLASDMRYWQEQGKYWFDKEQDLRPDINKYIAEMPSATDALSQGSLTGGKASNAVQGVVEPTGLGLEAIVTGGGTRNKEWVGAGEYASNEALEGAISGFGTGGWVGAIVGAALNSVMAVFTWSSAIDQDKKNKAQAQSQLEKKLKTWTIARNNRLLNQRKNTIAEKDRKLLEFKATKKTEQNEKNARAVSRRESIRQAFANAGTIAKSKRMERAKRWGRSYQNAA